MLDLGVIRKMCFVSEIFNLIKELPLKRETLASGKISTPGERDFQATLKMTAIIHLLQFSIEVFCLQKPEAASSYGQSPVSEFEGDKMWIMPISDKEFHFWLALLVFKPWEAGFVTSDIQESDKLGLLLTKILTCGPASLRAGVIDHLRQVLGEILREDFHSVSLSEVGTNDDRITIHLTHLLKGLLLVQRAGILAMCLDKVRALKIGERLLIAVFNLQRECPPALEPIALNMLAVSRALGVGIKKLLELVMDETPVASTTSKRKLTAGNVFYMNFWKVILQQIKFAYKVTLPVLLQSAVKNVTCRLLVNALFDELLRSPEDITTNSILQEFLEHLWYLEPCLSLSSGLTEKQFFLELVQKIMMLDKDHDVLQSAELTSFKFIKGAFTSMLAESHHGTSTGETKIDKNTQELLTNDCIALIPLLFSYKLDEKFRASVANWLTTVVTDSLLIRERELPLQSYQRVRYITLLERILHVVSLSRSLELLEVVFPLLQLPTKLSANRMRKALEVFANNNRAEIATVLNFCYGIVTDTKQAPSLRRAITDIVLPPLVSASDPLLIVEWYAGHMNSFVEILSSRIAIHHDSEKEIDDLNLRICHYRIVELLFSTVDDRLLKDSITPVVPNSKLMKLANDDARAKNDPTVKLHDANSQLWRDLHIFAYNCLAAIICRTQEQEKFFSFFLFKEGGNVGFIWQHLVDCNQVYDHLPVETASIGEVVDVVKELQIRMKQHTKLSGSSDSALSSQYIIGTTLSQEPAVIGSFVTDARRTLEVHSDLSPGSREEASNTEATTSKQKKAVNSNSPEAMVNGVHDGDDFDRHPSMGVLCKLLDHLHGKFGSNQSSPQQMPDWMKALHSCLSNSTTPVNVRLFLSKVVTRFWMIFAPYAANWFRPIVMAVLAEPMRSGGMRFHYILREMCVCVLQWNLLKPPDAQLGSKLVNHLMSVAIHESKHVLRSNISIIRLFLSAWKDDIEIDSRIIFNYLIADGGGADHKQTLVRRSVGLQLLGALVVSGFPLHNTLDAEACREADICKALLLNLEQKDKDIYEASAELVGITLKQRQKGHIEKDEQILEIPLKKVLFTFYKESQFDRFINVLNKLTLHCPAFLSSYERLLVDLVPQLHGLYKSLALDILLRSPDSLRRLCSMIVPTLPQLLAHRDESAQLKSLLLLTEIVQDMEVEVVREKILPVLCKIFSTHESLDCKERFYGILMFLYDSKGLQEDKLVLHYLLLGLCEGSEKLRYSLHSFWHSKLSTNLAIRFKQMLTKMYDSELEEQWAQYADVLLLQVSSN